MITTPQPGGALLQHAVRLLLPGATVVVVVTTGMTALVVGQYTALFGDASEVASLAALAESPAIRVLFGAPVALDTAGGFTVWRTGTPVALLLSVWALLVTTRLTRGDEEAGRWDALLAGPYRLPGVTGRYLAVGVAVLAVAGAGAAAALIGFGAGAAGAVRYGLALFGVGAAAATLGALAAQLVADRRRAVTLAVAVIGGGLAARMLGDGLPELSWLLWTSPFGLLALTEPFAANRTGPLVVLLGIVVVLVAGTLLASARRDLHAGLLGGSAGRRPRLLLLGSASQFAVRRAAGAFTAWAIGLVGYFLLIGGLASSLTRFLSDNPRFADLAAAAGFGGLGTVVGYAATLLTLLAIPVSLYAASRVGAAVADERSGRSTLLYAAPTNRRSWFMIDTLAALTGGVLLATIAGLATWVGTVMVGADLSLSGALAGALNVVPVLALSVGFAALAFGRLPQAVFALGAIPSVGGFLLLTFADTLRWPEWVRTLSPYAHLNAVPAEAPDWLGAAAQVLVGVILAGIGLHGYQRRDLPFS